MTKKIEPTGQLVHELEAAVAEAITPGSTDDEVHHNAERAAEAENDGRVAFSKGDLRIPPISPSTDKLYIKHWYIGYDKAAAAHVVQHTEPRKPARKRVARAEASAGLPGVEVVSIDEAQKWAVEQNDKMKKINKKFAKGEHTGGSVDYYQVPVRHPTTKGRKPYVAECNDIIEALQLDYAEGNVLKAIWRTAAKRALGKVKRNHDALYDAEKIIFFGQRLLDRAKREAE